jgi:outer membrane protein OmpA-like peptidoglycan-associated protein
LKEKQNEASEQYAKTDYYNTVRWADEVLKKLPDDMNAMQQKAMSEYGMRDYQAAAVILEKMLNKDKKAQQYQELRYYFAKCLQMSGKANEAKTQYESYAKYGKDATNVALSKVAVQGINYASNVPKDPKVVTKSAGNGINTPYSDIAGLYTSPTQIYYSSVKSKTLIKLKDDGTPKSNKVKDTHSKIYMSTNNNGTWSEGQALGAAINKLGVHNAHVAMSADGNALYFSRCQLNGMTANCDIYVSFKNGGNWTDAQKVTGGVNGDNFTSKQPAVGQINGRSALFFASNMSGGKGGYDIYYAVQQDGAKFGTPVNVGAPVNTVGNEETPFWAKDMLYFSSEGHPGFGGHDVFKAKQDGVKWGSPKNMGADVNSYTDDLHYTLDKTGYKATVTSNRPTEGEGLDGKATTCCYDIYTIDYPLPVIVDLEVLAFDDKGNELSGVTLALVEGSGRDEQKNDNSNFFSWEDLKKEVTYKVMATRDGYEPAEISVSTAGFDASTTLKEKISLKEIVIIDLDVVVTDKQGKPLNGVTVVLEEVGGSPDSKVNATDNKFSWKDLKKNTKYKITASKAAHGNTSYTAASQEFTTENISKSIVLEEALGMEVIVKVDPKRPIELPGINFDLGKHAIRDDAKPSLDKLVQLLNDFPAITKIEISAHTDAQGGDGANRALSQRRANAAIRYLASKGIATSRLKAVGYGESRLKNTKCGNGVKCTDDEHEINRRVEFVILQGPTSVPASYFLEGVTGDETIKNN